MDERLVWRKDLWWWMSYSCDGIYKKKRLYRICKGETRNPERFADLGTAAYFLSTQVGWDKLCADKLFNKEFPTLAAAISYAEVHLNQELKRLDNAPPPPAPEIPLGDKSLKAP